MGLDMSIYAVPADKVREEDKDKQVDFDSYYSHGATEIAYWRKHPNLHGRFEQLYRDKGGAGEDFNGGDTLRLTMEDLEAIEESISNDNLPHTTGFFFGISDASVEQRERDLDLITEAMKHVANGDFVYYNSSW